MAATVLLLHPRGATVAMGLFGMADRLDREDLPVRILHYQLERRLNRRFDLAAYLRLRDVAAVGISVHWAHQGFEALKISEQIKLRAPGVLVFWGGFTASAFAQEIVRDYQVVDAVIWGEGEEGVLAIARALARGARGPAEVFGASPNALWRDGDRIVHNSQRYVAGPEELSRLRFARYDLMSNHEVYLQNYSIFKEDFPSPTHFLCVGRGCPVNCPWCGGARTSYRLNTGRMKPTYRAVAAVVDDWRSALAAGCRSVYVCYEPVPNGPYYFELFERLRDEGLASVPLAFGCWAMPSPEFLAALHATFPRVVLELSPETSCEVRRKVVRGWSYSNEVLEDRLDRCRGAGIACDVYFSYPHPGETVRDIWATSQYASTLAHRFPGINVIMLALSTDPNSPLMQQPDAFDMYCEVRTFGDYVRGLARLERDQRPWLENELFHRPNGLGPEQVLRVGFGVHLVQALRRRAGQLHAGLCQLHGGVAEAERWLDEVVVQPLWRELQGRRSAEGRLRLDQFTLYGLFLESLGRTPIESTSHPALAALVGDLLRVHRAYYRVFAQGVAPDLHGRGTAVEHSYSPIGRDRPPVASSWRPVVNPSAEILEQLDPAAVDPAAAVDWAAAEAGAGRNRNGSGAVVFKDFDDRTRVLGLEAAEAAILRHCDGVATLAELMNLTGEGAYQHACALARRGVLL